MPKCVENEIICINDEIKMKIRLLDGQQEEIIILIDSGSQITLIGQKYIGKNIINYEDRINIKGAIKGMRMSTIGAIESAINVQNFVFPHKMYVIDNNISVGEAAGVLGSDFMLKYNCLLNFEKRIMSLRIPVNNNIVYEPKHEDKFENKNEIKREQDRPKKAFTTASEIFDMPRDASRSDGHTNTEFLEKSDNDHDNANATPLDWFSINEKLNILDENNEIIITERTYSIILMKTNRLEDIVIENKEIQPGIYIGNSISTPRNGYIIITIANGRENEYKLKYSDVEGSVNVLSKYDEMEMKPIEINNNNDEERNVALEKALNLSHCNAEERENVLKICRKYNSVFFLPGDKLGAMKTDPYRIPIKENTAPIATKQYRLPYRQREVLQQEIKKLLEDGVIEKSTSPWCSPVVIVEKAPDPSGKKRYRVAIDYRKINEHILSQTTPLPNIADILENLGKARYYTTIDLQSGFWQSSLHPDSRPITAFAAGEFLYNFTRIPMGIKVASNEFQRQMNSILLGLNNVCCFVFVDDLILYGNSEIDHNTKLAKVLERLQEYNVKINPTKTSILKTEANFLGVTVSAAGIYPQKEKIEAIAKMPVPKTLRAVKSTVGTFSFFRKFIPKFSDIIKPINNLLRKDAVFKWDEACDKAFNILKEKLISKPILQHVDFTLPWILRTDASCHASAAVLSQGELGSDLPVGYMSKSFSKCERRYPIVELELLAIIHAIRFFRHFLYMNKFLLLCDNRALSYIKTAKPNQNSRLMRWTIELSQMDFEIRYISSHANIIADHLSRIHFSEELKTKVRNLDADEKIVAVTTRSKVNNENANTKVQKEYVKFVSDVVLIESDIAHISINKLREKEEFRIYIIMDEISYPFELIEGNIKLSKNEQIIHVDRNSMVIYISKETTEEFFLNTWKSNMEKMMVEKREKIYIFINWIPISIYNMVRTTILTKYHNSKIEINLISNKVILVEDENDKTDIIYNFHNNVLGGHIGIKGTIENIKRRYYWPGMGEQVKKMINNCLACKKNKITRHTRVPMHVADIGESRSFKKIIFDAVGPIRPPTQSGNMYILTFICELTKFCEAIPTENIQADTVAKVFVENIICRHSIPEVILSDLGSNLVSNVLKNMCEILRIKQEFATVTRQETVGSVERFHRYLGDYLRIFVENDKDNWDTYLPFATYVMNTKKNESTGYSPHFLVYGWSTDYPMTLKSKPSPVYDYENYILVMKNRMRTAHDIAKKYNLECKQINKHYYDKKLNSTQFNVGDLVFVINDQKNHKFDNRYKGPWPILSMTDENCTIKQNGKPRTYHKNKLKPA